MKTLSIFCLVFALVASKPNGYYHQEYNYKSSSSSFKNNELQHKNENQGFYSKDGDLEGRFKPKIDSHSQHSEYTNPKLLSGSGHYIDGNYLGGSSLGAGGYASSDRVADLTSQYQNVPNQDYFHGGTQSGYGSHSTHWSSQGSSNYQRHDANLNSLMQRLQSDMAAQLQNAVRSQHRTSGYTSSITNSQMSADVRTLEDELRRNLTRQLQESLRSQYGQQYHRVEGQPSVNLAPTYNTQELTDLTQQVQDNLIQQLHQNVRTTYNSQYSNNYYPTPEATTYRSYPSNIQYTPVRNPQSLTTIVSGIQSNVNTYLDNSLNDVYTKYLQTQSNSYYSLEDFDREAERLKADLLRKLTISLDDQIRQNYGHQVLKGDYYYTVASNGETSSQYNYNIRDYENLRKQIEENLLRKLNQTINNYRDQYQRLRTQQVTYRPALYTSGAQTYDYSELQRQLSQQVQNALTQHTPDASYSYNSQAYQKSLDELTRELQRNLTEQLSSYKAQQSSSSSSSGYGYSSDYESMKNQLQNQLMQQLQQGLQKQYRYTASASYSASSASASNGHYGGRQSYGNHESFIECCQTINPLNYRRNKRDAYSWLESSRSQAHNDLTQQQLEDPFTIPEGNSRRPKLFSSYVAPASHLGDINDLTQQSELNRGSKYDQQLTGAFGSYQELQQPQPLEISSSKYSKFKQTSRYEQHSDLGEEFNQQLDLSSKIPSKHQQTNIRQFATQETHQLQNAEEQFTQQLQLTGPKTSKVDQTSKYTEYIDGLVSGSKLYDYKQSEGPNKAKPKQLPKFVQDLLDSDIERKPQRQQFHAEQETHQLQNAEEQFTQQLQLTGSKTSKVDQTSKYTQYIDGLVSGSKLYGHQQPEDLNTPKPKQLPKYVQDLLDSDIERKPQLQQLHPDQEDQQLEVDSSHKIIDQQLETIPKQNKIREQKLEDQSDLTQQIEVDSLHKSSIDQQLLDQELETSSKPARIREHKLQTQTSEDQQLEVDSMHQSIVDQLLETSPKHSKVLTQQLEVDQQLENTPKPARLREHKLQTQILEDQNDLTQQRECDQEEDNPKPAHVRVYKQQTQVLEDQNDLTQQLEVDQKLETTPKPARITKHKLPTQILEDQNDLTQQLEVDQAFEQNLENTPKPARIIKHKLGAPVLEDQNDLTQQLEVDQQLETTPKPTRIREHKLETQVLEDQNDLSQQLEVDQHLETSPKLNRITEHKLPTQILEDQNDLTQQLEVDQELESSPKPARIQEHKLQTQVLEDQNDLTQQLEVDSLHKSITNQQLETTPKPARIREHKLQTQLLEDQNDLTQQLEVDSLHKSIVDQQLEGQVDQQLETNPKPTIITEHKLQTQTVGHQNGLTQQLEVDQQLETSPKPARIREHKLQTQTLEDQNDLTQQLEVDSLHKSILGITPKPAIIQEHKIQTQVQTQKLEVNSQHKSIFDQQLQGQVDQELETEHRPKTQQLEVDSLHKSIADQHLETIPKPLRNTEHTLKPLNQFAQKLEDQDLPEPHNYLRKPIIDQQLEGQLLLDQNQRQSELQRSPQKQYANNLFQSQFQQQLRPTATADAQQIGSTSNYQVVKHTRITNERPFTNAHSAVVRNNNYEAILRQQDALLDLLKHKVEAARANTGSTTTRHVYVNEVPNQHLDSQSLTRQYFTNLGNNPQILDTQFSGKSTKRVIHYVNGKPVSATENVEIRKPNGEIVTSDRDLLKQNSVETDSVRVNSGSLSSGDLFRNKLSKQTTKYQTGRYVFGTTTNAAKGVKGTLYSTPQSV